MPNPRGWMAGSPVTESESGKSQVQGSLGPEHEQESRQIQGPRERPHTPRVRHCRADLHCGSLAGKPTHRRTAHRLADLWAERLRAFRGESAYHLVNTTPHRELLLRRMDHAAIFLLIAGTYTPVCVTALSGPWGTALLIGIWTLAAAGTLIHLVFIERVSRWLSIVLYAIMGWLGVVAAVPLFRALPPAALEWLIGGGLVYTAGAVVYASRKLDVFPGRFGTHEFWHLFVTTGAACHFVFIYFFIAPFPS